jgi:hypothetical protein
LAELHINLLAKQVGSTPISSILKSLPEDWTATYRNVMSHIWGQNEDAVERARQVLGWLTYAKQSLTIHELQVALAIDEDREGLDEENLPDIEHSISVCAPLVTLDRKSGIVRLLHRNTQKYLYIHLQRRFPDIQATIATTCLLFISLAEDSHRRTLTGSGWYPGVRQFTRNYLLPYAVQYWGAHARTQEQKVQQQIQDFLRDESKRQFLIRKLQNLEGSPPREELEVSELCIAAIYGLDKTVASLIETDKHVSKDGEWIALHYAAMYGHESVVRLMLQKGANFEAIAKPGGTALTFAATYGHETIVRFLLERGASIDYRSDRGTALDKAAQNGHEPVAQLLLEATSKKLGLVDQAKNQRVRNTVKEARENFAHPVWLLGHDPRRIKRMLK